MQVVVMITAAFFVPAGSVVVSPADDAAAVCFYLQVIYAVDEADQAVEQLCYCFDIGQLFSGGMRCCQGETPEGFPEAGSDFFWIKAFIKYTNGLFGCSDTRVFKVYYYSTHMTM